MSGETIGLSGELYEYYAKHAAREPAILKELRAETAKLGGSAAMQIGPEQGAFMGLLVKLMGARRILEIGTFTGYSSLAMALGSEARIICADVSKEWTDVARRYWQKAGVAARIELHLDGGAALIERLLLTSEKFDLIFIDADKPGYDTYYEGGLKLFSPGGVILIDNTLWNGAVANPAKTDADTIALRALNAKIAADPRVEFVMLPLGDGLTLARKK